MVAKVRKDKAKTSSSSTSRKKSTKQDDGKEAKSASTKSTSSAHEPTKFTPYEPTKGEEYMNDKQLAHFKDILQDWKKDLMEEVDHTITELKEASVLADPNDRATQEETFNLELRTRDRERKLLKKIEEALQQIEDKDYGFCETWGIEIGIRRLEARPTATLCIDCKTLAEIRDKRA